MHPHLCAIFSCAGATEPTTLIHASRLTGSPHTSAELNDALFKMVRLLDENGITNWFIAYGTLLGIVRDGSCIDGDDDVDILVDVEHQPALLAACHAAGLKTSHQQANQFMRVHPDNARADVFVDIYFADVSSEGHFYDRWEEIKWEYCLPLARRRFAASKLGAIDVQLPADPETKLKRKYGADWRTPRKYKGVNRFNFSGKVNLCALNRPNLVNDLGR